MWGPGGIANEYDWTEKLLHTSWGGISWRSQSRIRVWKRLRILGSPDWEHVDTKRRHVYQCADGAQPARDKVGVG